MSEERTAAEVPLPGGEFRLFITRLSYQAMMSLGILENPITNSRQVQLSSARMMIDDLRMLQRVTVGNLDEDEQEHMDKVVSDLERAYEEVNSGRFDPVEAAEALARRGDGGAG